MSEHAVRNSPAPGSSAGFSRRGFLARVGAGIGTAAAARLAVAGGGVAALGLVDGASAATSFTQPLTFPPVLTSADITLVAAETPVQVLPGKATTMWTFNGSFPGPTIRRPSGTPTRLTVQHRLPAEVGTLTIHHHGAHVPTSEDGSPHSAPVPVGGERTYTYDFIEEGKPERAAMQWYHDHTHFRTSRNAWKGLIGMFIVDDAVDAALPLPRGEFDLPLVITEREFDTDNQLTAPYKIYGDAVAPGAGPGYAPNDDIIGRRVLVNGVPEPYLEVAARRYRVRILNASHFRPYNLVLSDDMEFTQIGTEAGLLPAPVPRTSALIGPAERVELVIDFTGRLGQKVQLGSVGQAPSSTGLPATAAAAFPNGFLEFRVTRTAADESSVPAALRPLPGWVASAPTTPDRVWAFGVGVDPQGRSAWVVNGQAFDHERVDAKPELGSVETWAFVNITPNISHYIHIHDVDWMVISRNGAAPTPESGESGLKETFRLDPGERLLVAARFTEHLGKYMIHCHMLEHEDHGMMTTWEVVPPGSGDRRRGFDAVLARDVPDPAVRAHVVAVMNGACDGHAAPSSLLYREHLRAVALCSRSQPGAVDAGTGLTHS